MPTAEYQRLWRERHPGRHAAHMKVFRQRHPGRNAETVRAYQQADPERARQQNESARRNHSEERKPKVNAYRKAHPEIGRASQRNRRARLRGNGGSCTAAEEKALKAFYGKKCLCCGKTERQLKILGRRLVLDHVIPLAKGGGNDVSNLQPLCHALPGFSGGCNSRKGHRHTIDYRCREWTSN